MATHFDATDASKGPKLLYQAAIEVAESVDGEWRSISLPVFAWSIKKAEKKSKKVAKLIGGKFICCSS